MPHSRKWLAACLIVLFASPVCAQSTMVGTWFGQGQPHSKESMYIDRMRAGGSWRGEYRTCIKGKSSDQVQEGRWSLVGDMLILKVEFVDGRSAARTDSYKMLAHTATSQKYVSLGWNFPYTPKKMADDFQMPSCELTS
ncbi:MAG TPA: hypothetical protein VJS85_04765 [Rhizomicrobium sp.]|nr:hypothetical protein [Rhizomicrobium sp.]